MTALFLCYVVGMPVTQTTLSLITSFTQQNGLSSAVLVTCWKVPGNTKNCNLFIQEFCNVDL
jgi:hypothetical protein